MTNRFLAHTGATYPIIQAPMGWIARAQLASAVCEAGGLGVIETSSGETDICKAEITKMFSLTKATIFSWSERMISHTGTETRSRLLREAAVGNIGQWGKP